MRGSGPPWKAGDALLLGRLASAFGIEAPQEESDLGGLGVKLVGEVFDAVAMAGQARLGVLGGDELLVAAEPCGPKRPKDPTTTLDPSQRVVSVGRPIETIFSVSHNLCTDLRC